ncbi:MAG: hypothetical protein ACTSXC_02580 [Candidatus Freyarchaeota archaeon]
MNAGGAFVVATLQRWEAGDKFENRSSCFSRFEEVYLMLEASMKVICKTVDELVELLDFLRKFIPLTYLKVYYCLV